MNTKTHFEFAAKAKSLGFNWISKDANQEWFAFVQCPFQTMNAWKCNEDFDYRWIGKDDGVTSKLDWKFSRYRLT